MIALDTNLLIYAHRREMGRGEIAVQAIEKLANQSEPWGIPTPCVAEFCAVASNAKVFAQPSTRAQLADQVAQWANAPAFRWLHTTDMHWAQLLSLANTGDITGGQYHDARIAAICIENGVREFWTADRDFSRFPALKTRNPLFGLR
jgi:uncharacterized protein